MKDTKKGLILIIEDNTAISGLIADCLEGAGFETDFAVNGVDGLRLSEENAYSAILLDGALPRMDGLEVCKQIRARREGHVPILFLTARDTLEDKVAGLDAGADDYLVKPFEPKELLARLEGVLRRARREVAPELLTVGDMELDSRTFTVSRSGREVQVSPTGFRILRHLMRESPRVIPRKSLELEIWGADPPDSDSLRSHIYTLRKAIDKGGGEPLLHTLPSQGYRVSSDAQPGAVAAQRRG